MDFRVTRLYRETIQSTARYLVHEGGSRSSKTYSILQTFIKKMHSGELKGVTWDVVRKTMPALRATAMKDFFDILQNQGYYNRDWHNKTECIYRMVPFNNEIAFYGLDQEQKVRGRKRHYVFANEANELTEGDFLQLRLRTLWQLIFDYNPSDQFHWIYDKVLPKENCQVIKSTYLDNNFLDPEILKEIESLKYEDPEAWNVYGLGLHGVNQALVFPNFNLVDKMPETVTDDCYGLDLGWTGPTALIDIAWVDAEPKPELYCDQIIYKRHLTTKILVDLMEEAGVDKNRVMYVDSASGGAKLIEELYQLGYNAVQADKSKGSVQDGIRSVLSYNLNVTKRSAETIKELRGYRRKTDKAGNILEDPVKFNDHSCDSIRYGAHTSQWVTGVRSWIVA